ncbi:hypothetical protein [Pseudoalteromonas sp. DL-6]|uniref:hypothetical protein n=1 Tax=Pseudoalteromonas sp. DL-6 TaxID=1390185 RepID=UPI0010398972|nr:hypothetical protein [Pseudoalteromonas sp. DL-6]QBJ64145.1 hypothetical protein B1F84_14480 [Pseudoalteromonas sp. DL-6]
MENYIGLVIIVLLLIIQNRYTLHIYQYLAKHYPEQWEKLSQNSLGGSPYANLAESFKDGFFSTINDSKVVHYHKFKTLNLLVMVIIACTGLLHAFLT